MKKAIPFLLLPSLSWAVQTTTTQTVTTPMVTTPTVNTQTVTTPVVNSQMVNSQVVTADQVSTAQTTAPKKPEYKFVKGKVINAFVVNKLDDRPIDPMGGFVYKGGSPYKLSIIKDEPSLSFIKSPNTAMEISGWFKAEESGRYSFSTSIEYPIEVDRNYDDFNLACTATLTINDNDILDTQFVWMEKGSKSLSGQDAFGVDLKPGYYELKQWVACVYDQGNGRKAVPDKNFNVETFVRYKAPSELAAKDISDNLYLRKKN